MNAGGGWRDISTAPKTGELFWAAWNHQPGEPIGVHLCRWADEAGEWVDDEFDEFEKPTVWRPLGGAR